MEKKLKNLKELAYNFTIAELRYRDSCHDTSKKKELDKIIEEKELAFQQFVSAIKGEQE